MNKKTIRDVDLSGKRVVMRVDFNVPLAGGKVDDDTRIRGALPTIKHVLDNGASLVLMSHLGRPKGKVKPEFSLKPAADRLSELLGRDVVFVPDCVGEETLAAAKALKPGEVLVLENLRFHPEEEGKPRLPDDATDDQKQAAKAEMEKGQKEFAASLAALGDVYVDDAFGTAHRAHASMSVITEFMDVCVAGFLLEKEIEYLGNAVADPKRPFLAIIGGAKISGKIDVLMNLAEKVDAFIIGGGMVYTFYRAKGFPIGDSIVEEDKIELAKETLAGIEKAGVKLLLPIDHVVAHHSTDASHKIVGERDIEDGWKALDIGPETVKLFLSEIAGARTIVWNGPMGYFEKEQFAAGTNAVTRAVADNTDCVSIIGGGDSVSAVNKSGLADRMTHISTGGGASLTFLEGKDLPGIAALDDK